MGTLHLVPYVLLFAVTAWLVWPMIADPIQRRLGGRFHPDAPSPDGVADSLFIAWADEDTPNGQPRQTA